MPTQQFDYVIFIGRFQPVHNGHLAAFRYALQVSAKVIVICGSARQARSPRNPWTLEEREQLIRSALPDEMQGRVFVGGVSDRMYNDQQWLTEVQNLVDKVIAVDTTSLGADPTKFRIGIIGGHMGDKVTYYLDMFPQWTRIEVPVADGVSASVIRDDYFAQDDTRFIHDQDILPQPVYDWLTQFRATPVYQSLTSEYAYIKNYHALWARAPYPPTFVTVDAVVIHSGHVLLIRRRHFPGKGLWALPGGFVGQDERIREAVIRELREETRLKVPAAVLAGSIHASHVFDLPQRSMRGRTISHAFLMELAPTQEGLPKVRGADDADRARWVPLFEFNRMEDQLFDDHFYIVNWFLGQI